MKRKFFSAASLLTVLTLAAAALPGCSQNESGSSRQSSSSDSVSVTAASSSGIEAASSGNQESSSSESETSNASEQENETEPSESELFVAFGNREKPFILHLYDNTTAAAIARHVGTASWQLPIYHYDDYEGWEVMQYYDIPSRYEIPSNAENITSEAAGTVYYSEPNRIVLFFHEAEISGEYTPVGYFDYTDEFVSAVENNPVLEGWGNKLVFISPAN